MENLYQVLETRQLHIKALSPPHPGPEEPPGSAHSGAGQAEAQLERRWAELPTGKKVKGYVADFGEFLLEEAFLERKVLIRKFVQGVEIVEDEAVLTYTIPMPQDGVKSESASVLDFIQFGGPKCTVGGTIFEMWLGGL